MISRPFTTLSCALALGACQTPSPPLQPLDPDEITVLEAREFPGAPGLLAGFVARPGNPAWARGDSVLFGLRLARRGEVQRWLLQLTVLLNDGDRARDALGHGLDADVTVSLPPRKWNYSATIAGERKDLVIRSAMSLVAVGVYDEHGVELGRSQVQLPSDLMTRGLLPGIETALRHHTRAGSLETFAREEDVRPMAEGLIALVALLNVVQHDPVLVDYFWLVVQRPSLWSVVRDLGVAASLTAALEMSVTVSVLPGALPPAEKAYRMPLRVDVNGTAALEVDVTAVDPAPPYGLCAGIIAATARHPTEEGVRFDVQMLAARSASRE